MRIKYDFDLELELKARDIINTLGMKHVRLDNVTCMRSRDSSAKNTIARCHALSRIWQKVLNTKAQYIIEVISENFDNLSKEDQEKTILHEILHIPKAFGGGFKHHSNWVTEDRVNNLYRKYKKLKD